MAAAKKCFEWDEGGSCVDFVGGRGKE